MSAKLTKTFVEKLPFQETGQKLYLDPEIKGFGVLVGRTKKSYIVQRDINGRTKRVTIGAHGVFTAEQARGIAREYLVRMTKGEDPNQTKRLDRDRNITLGEAMDAYAAGRKNLSKASLYKLDVCKRLYMPDWVQRPLKDIGKDAVLKRLEKLGKERGEATANKALRVFRAVYNFALNTNDYLPANPVVAVSKSGSWYREEKRRSFIKPSELAQWFGAVELIDNSTIRDYLKLLLFTGMRKVEGLTLRWENVNFAERYFTVPDTKNRQPLTLPMSDYLLELFEQRKKRAGDSPFVFPSFGKSGHLIEPKKTVWFVSEKSGIPFILHDLRRSFVTVAESCDIPAYALRKMLNHKAADMTENYVQITVERLREPMQKVTDKLLSIIHS